MNELQTLLIVLDGFGIGKENAGNAIYNAKMKFFNSLKQKNHYLTLHASGNYVGLPKNQMGSSEVGHIHIGAGKVVRSSLKLINDSLADNSFFKNVEINNAIEYAKKNNSTFHIWGLLSNGGVHSHINHYLAALKLASLKNIKKVALHIVGDGRDTKPKMLLEFVTTLQEKIKEYNCGVIATISGRFYAMDRDKRWEKVQKAYDVVVNRKGNSFIDPKNYIESEYLNLRYDEFLMPAFNLNFDGQIKDNDSLFFVNFRPDRAIQLASCLSNDNYFFTPKKRIKNLYFVCMVKYSNLVNTNHFAFKQEIVENPIGKIIANSNLSQLRVAETEKIAHVTYFLDGGNHLNFKNEKKLLIPSPKVKTYDLQPEMSAYLITKGLIKELKNNFYNFTCLNFANADMVGHTGNLKAAIKANQVIEECIKEIFNFCKKQKINIIISADHGNAEVMLDQNNKINKKHTCNIVPFIFYDFNQKWIVKAQEKDFSIANIAPTILDLLNIKIPTSITKTSLIKKAN